MFSGKIAIVDKFYRCKAMKLSINKTVFQQAALGVAALVSVFGSLQAVQAADEVNVYSARQEQLILPLLERFTEETGVKVNLVTGKADELLKRIELEAQATPADVFITVDAGNLHRAKQAGVLQEIENSVLQEAIDENLRDSDNQWFGLSMRARPIFYIRGKGWEDKIDSYEDLSDESVKGKLCIRSSSNIYNQSLVASLIEHLGDDTTEAWAKGVVKNFARNPAGGDTDQIKAVAAGVCELAVANTYYYGRLANSDSAEDKAIVEKVGIIWPNQDDRGTHVNVSGAGITKHSKNKDNAVKLLEFLVSLESQKWYAQVNNEYPVVKDAEVESFLQTLGEFKADDLPLTVLGENNRASVELMDRAGWQ